MEKPQTITLMGRTFPVARPDFATAEELLQQLVAADRTVHEDGGAARVHRARAAVLGVCSQIGEKAGASWTRHRCDALAYGGQVYSWLREQGATADEVLTEAAPLVLWLLEWCFPRSQEVKDQRDFT